jgi:hypothetical protein
MVRGEKTAVPDFFGSSFESASGDEWPATQYSTRGGVDCSYETALDVRDGPNVYAYVQQNPWTKFDPHGLNGEYAVATMKFLNDGMELGVKGICGVVNGVGSCINTADNWISTKLTGESADTKRARTVERLDRLMTSDERRASRTPEEAQMDKECIERSLNFSMMGLGGGVKVPKTGSVKPPAPKPGGASAQVTGEAAAAQAEAAAPGTTAPVPGGRGKNNLKPDSRAEDAHTTFKTDKNGKVTGHAEWTPNSQNPSGFDQVKRVDTQYAPPTPHTNSVTGEKIPTPHTHDKTVPGGVRPATPDELPNKGK